LTVGNDFKEVYELTVGAKDKAELWMVVVYFTTLFQ
jgi:hypothetical protein